MAEVKYASTSNLGAGWSTDIEVAIIDDLIGEVSDVLWRKTCGKSISIILLYGTRRRCLRLFIKTFHVIAQFGRLQCAFDGLFTTQQIRT